MPQLSKTRRALILGSVIAGAGAMFPLPFLRQAYCEPLLAALHLSNTQLAMMNAAYGTAAILCYLPGGWLADRCAPRQLLCLSLVGSGLAGFGFAAFPPLSFAIAIHAVWGLLCVLTFWAAMLKLTSHWGGDDGQGVAFGLLDGGRGLVEALFAVFALVLFAAAGSPVHGLRGVISFYSIACLVTAVAIFFCVPRDYGAPRGTAATKGPTARDVLAVMRLPIVWIVSIVIGTAYATFWGSFDIPSFSIAAFDGTATSGAALGTFRMWLRPAAGALVCLLVGRFSKSAIVVTSMMVVTAGYLCLTTMPASSTNLTALWIVTAVLATAIFVVKGVYFALLTDSPVPEELRGTAIGIVSLLGFLPDLYMPPLMGGLADAYPGATGHRLLYLVMSVFAVIGAGAALFARKAAPSKALSECGLPAS